MIILNLKLNFKLISHFSVGYEYVRALSKSMKFTYHSNEIHFGE